jgi:hypothetical protein
MADTASFSGAMKTKFIGPIRDNLWKGKVLLFGTSSDAGDAPPEAFRGIIPTAEGIDFVGNEFRIPYKTKRNNSVGFRSENEDLPAPGSGAYTYLTEPMRYAYALFNITGQLLKAAESNEGAFRSAYKAEMEDTTLASKMDVNRAAHGDGSGAMCAITGTPDIAQDEVTVDTTVNFRGDEVVDFVDATGTVVSGPHVVTGIDRPNLTITVSPVLAAGLTSSEVPVRASTDSTVANPNNSFNREIQGLDSIVDDTGNLHGLNPATVPQWKSYVDAISGPVDDSVLRSGKDAIGFEAGLDTESGLDFALVTTRGIRNAYADGLVSLKQFTNADSVKLRGGFTALFFDENPIFVDDQTKPGTIFGLSLNKLFWSQMSDWEWLDKDGDILKWESRKDRFIAVLYKYCQLGTTHRGAHFKLTDVDDDTR